jgi:transposase InsO family protein
MRILISALLVFLRALLMPKTALALENTALRQQNMVLQRVTKRPSLQRGDRIFWALLRTIWSDWARPLSIVKPATVIGWANTGLKALWRSKSRPGRPRIPRKHINFIKRMSSDHPEWGEDKIVEELAAKFGIDHSGSTVRRYMVARGKPPRSGQTWHTFVMNHASELWACDFLTQYTAFLNIAYVFIVMEIGSRRIVHWGVTTSPTLPWVKQQLREATPWGETPRFLIHDNDGIFGQYRTKPIVDKDGHKRSYRCHLDLWLDTVMGIDGIPIPYGAPNANAHVERFNRTLREDALDHFIFLGARHVRRVVAGFVEYYNRARPSQAIHGIPDPYPELKGPPPPDGKLVALPVLGGIHHDYRLAA